MSVRVVFEPPLRHVCVLPDPWGWEVGAVVECDCGSLWVVRPPVQSPGSYSFVPTWGPATWWERRRARKARTAAR